MCHSPPAPPSLDGEPLGLKQGTPKRPFLPLSLVLGSGFFPAQCCCEIERSLGKRERERECEEESKKESETKSKTDARDGQRCQSKNTERLTDKIGVHVKGVVLTENACFLPSKCLLESPFLEALLKTPRPSKTHCKTPEKPS